MSIYTNKISVILCLASIIFPVTTMAIVDMEGLHLDKSQAGLSGRFELAAFSSSGNTEKNEASLGAKLEWKQVLHTFFGAVDYSYGQDQGESNIDKGFVHLRYIYQFHDVLASETFLQTDRDEFRRLSYRGIAGTGLRYSVYEQPDKGAAYLGAGLFYEKEVLNRDDDIIDETITETGRGNIYLILKYKINESTILTNSTYYQPDLRYSVDYRASESASLVVAINKSLALKLSAVATHDSQPPEEVEQTDTTYRTSILYQF